MFILLLLLLLLVHVDFCLLDPEARAALSGKLKSSAQLTHSNIVLVRL